MIALTHHDLKEPCFRHEPEVGAGITASRVLGRRSLAIERFQRFSLTLTMLTSGFDGLT
jgi:hypothetical protein